MRDVILHAFNWTYAEVASQAKDISKIGYGAVLLPPPLYSNQNSSSWWQRYQPVSYSVGRSRSGDSAAFVSMVT